MNEPDFLGKFSKQESQKDRDTLAQEIRQTRTEYFDSKKIAEKNLDNKKQEVAQNQEMLEQTLDQISNLQNRLEEISTNLPSKIFNYIEYLKILSRLKNYKSQHDVIQLNQDFQTQEELDIQKELDSIDFSGSRQEAKEAITQFYNDQKEKWIHAEYSKEDIKDNFNPEHLAELSLEEYILLLKRFPNTLVTHVTRQGIRDHVGAVNHHAGIDKISNGFKDILNAGELKSSFDIHVTENMKKQEFINFLNLKDKTKEQALEDVEYLAGEDTQHHHGSISDRMSLHVATEEVADAHYGAEKGNEIFFAYPSAMIASQYTYSGQLTEASGGYHNNQWIFAEEGLDINSGLVFIPKQTRVDRVSGSKYELDENSEPILNIQLQNKLKETVSQKDFIDFIKIQENFLASGRFDVNTLFDEEPQTTFEQEAKRKILEACSILNNTFEITDVSIQKLILNYEFIRRLIHNNEDDVEEIIQNRMAESGLKFTLAQDTVFSEEYWEEYFVTHVDKKPNKVVYYEGEDPTRALQIWKQKNGLIKNSSFEFDENKINLSNPDEVKVRVERVSRFRTLSSKIIEEFYTKK